MMLAKRKGFKSRGNEEGEVVSKSDLLHKKGRDREPAERTEKDYRPKKKMSRRKMRAYFTYISGPIAVILIIVLVVRWIDAIEPKVGNTEKIIGDSGVKILVLDKNLEWGEEWSTEVEQGSQVTVQLKLTNIGDERGGYNMECKSLPAGWSADFDMPLVSLDGSGEEKNVVATVFVGEPGEAILKFTATSTEVDGLSVNVPVTIKVTPVEKADEDSGVTP